MDAWSSRASGLGLDAIEEGFTQQRQVNKSLKRAMTGVEKGFETRYLRNRALFSAKRAQEIPEGRSYEFVDHKVWSA